MLGEIAWMLRRAARREVRGRVDDDLLLLAGDGAGDHVGCDRLAEPHSSIEPARDEVGLAVVHLDVELDR